MAGKAFNLTKGVLSFNGRTGAVQPKAGDYTADDVGARPDDWTPTAADVGAIPISNALVYAGFIPWTSQKIDAATSYFHANRMIDKFIFIEASFTTVEGETLASWEEIVKLPEGFRGNGYFNAGAIDVKNHLTFNLYTDPYGSIFLSDVPAGAKNCTALLFFPLA